MILVTGASGFIGTAVCRELAARGLKVRGVDLRAAPLPEGCEFMAGGDLARAADWTEALRGVEAVVHLAARVHVMKETVGDPLRAFREVNVAGTERLARQAAAAGARRLVFMSSVKVNGEGRPEPYTEEDPPAPEDPYGISKREAEEALRRVAEETGLEVVILRPPLVYGPGVKANFLQLLETVSRGIPLPLGAIRNRRSLIGLRNLADAVAVCACHPRAAGNTFLVCDGDEVSTPELVRRLAAALGRPPRLFPVPWPLMRLAGALVGKGASMKRLSDSLTIDAGRIRRELGWQSPFTMAQELKEMADWYKRGTPRP